MAHSIPDAFAVALTCDLGTTLITGDYKFDQTPVDGVPADVSRLAELGREGLLLLCGDSTNADRPGMSPSESSVGPHLEEAFARCSGRIVVTCFASNIHRVQQVVDAAAALGRKVALVGRSMRKNVNIGRSLGHIDIPDGLLIGMRELEDFPDHKLVIVSTGSQGEPLSALRRMAHGDHPQVALHDGDTVMFSATPIPGNERAVNETIDRIYRLGAAVVTTARRADPRLRPRLRRGAEADAQPHQAALRDADARRLPPAASARGAGAGGRHRRATTSSARENGTPLEIDAEARRFGEPEQAGMIFVDGVDVGDIEDVALRDRRTLSADGILIVVATISAQDGNSVAEPEIIFRGVPFAEDARRLRRRPARRRRGLARPLGHRADPRDRPAAGPPARRPGGVRLRARAPAADGAAGRRGGLSPAPVSASGPRARQA